MVKGINFISRQGFWRCDDIVGPFDGPANVGHEVDETTAVNLLSYQSLTHQRYPAGCDRRIDDRSRGVDLQSTVVGNMVRARTCQSFAPIRKVPTRMRRAVVDECLFRDPACGHLPPLAQ